MDRGPWTGDPRRNVWGFDKHNTRVCTRVLAGLFYVLFIVLLFVAVGWLCAPEVGGAVEALARSKRSYTWYTTAAAVEESHMCRTCGRSYNTSTSKVVISPVLRGQCGESTPTLSELRNVFLINPKWCVHQCVCAFLSGLSLTSILHHNPANC